MSWSGFFLENGRADIDDMDRNGQNALDIAVNLTTKSKYGIQALLIKNGVIITDTAEEKIVEHAANSKYSDKKKRLSNPLVLLNDTLGIEQEKHRNKKDTPPLKKFSKRAYKMAAFSNPFVAIAKGLKSYTALGNPE